MIPRKLISYIDWTLIGVLILISIIGVFVIYSASHYIEGKFYLKQIIWIVFSLVALLIIISVDYHRLVSNGIPIYFGMILVLIFLLIFGKSVSGAKSWINLGFFNIQPSEFTKIAVILVLANILSRVRWDYISWKEKLLGGGIVCLPIVLIILQPDLGTAMTYLPIYLAALFITGLNKKILIILLLILFMLSLAGWNFILKDYQRERIVTFLFPEKDPLGSGYHIIQSKIAIGSGGFLGKGYKKGTQSQLKFLPARHTDFILSVLGEEFGYLGIIVIFSLYFVLFYRLFHSIDEAKDRTGIYLIFLVSILLIFQFLINVAMVIGFFPVAGIPLPLMSYGGSALITTYLGIGLVINVKMRKFVYG